MAVIAIASSMNAPDFTAMAKKEGQETTVIHSFDDWQKKRKSIGGVILPGGTDVNPRLYGEDRNPLTQKPNGPRDKLESIITRSAIKHDIPLLGICRGHQLINIITGGTLYQDLTYGPGESVHPHLHDIQCNGKLREIIGRRLRVNSLHHQAIDRLGAGFSIVARAFDGNVEAIWNKDLRYCLGVQFHPEYMMESNFAKSIIKSFAAACVKTETDGKKVEAYTSVKPIPRVAPKWEQYTIDRLMSARELNDYVKSLKARR